MRMLTLPALATAAFFQTASAHADPLVHQGFMARFGLGIGYTSTSETVGSSTFTASGGAAVLHIAVGGYVIPNFALHGTIWGGSVVSPSVSVSGSGSTVTGTATNASLLATAIGVGATYVLSPIDLYVSASVGAGVLRLESTRGLYAYSYDTATGLALNLAVGKQWAVSPAWGLGVSGQFAWQSNPDNAGSAASSSYSLSTVQLGVLFSATYH